MTMTPETQPTQQTIASPATQPVTLPRRYPPAPLVGVAAVVLDDAGRVLLIQRGREPRKGSWGLPGGMLDLGERLVDGVRREVLEETGLVIEVEDLLAAFEPIYRDSDGRIEYHYVVLDYWARVLSGTATPSDDADAVAWVDVANADLLASWHLSADTARVVALGRERWLAWRAAQETPDPPPP